MPTTRSVFKIICGEKYFIGKASSIEWLSSELKTTYGKYLRGGIPETNMFYPVLREYVSKELEELEIEVLFSSDNGYELLKFELEQLIAHYSKPGCLNPNNIPYIPKTTVAAKGSNWLTQNQALNFRKLLKKYSY